MRSQLVIISLLVAGSSHSQSKETEKMIQAGNAFYKNQEFNKAAVEYGKALQADPANTTAKFNQGNTLYRLDQKVEAAKAFTALSRETEIKDIRSRSFYNKGVILSQQKNLEESIEAYKNALRNEPNDKEARENLQKALLELKKKTPPPKKDDKKDKKQDPKKQKQPQSKMNQKEAEQRLNLLQQKEKEVQQRLQKAKSRMGGSQAKDW
ncbi:MAG TPA: tetratricopeptide repeat protein [Chitinophagaceae bacterium]|nr:tetratricopeptide repeat protein [Chitinophagaceae bacterium]